MRRIVKTFCLLLLALGVLGFESADVVYDECKGKPENAVCSEYAGKDAGRAKNVILMIGDGMGVNQVFAARVQANGPGEPLALESLPRRALVTTCSRSGYTDSAAAATALATGHKAFVKDISTSPEGQEYETLLELAQKLGKSAGLVTTADITDATPAAFGAHVPARKERQGVAEDYLGQTRPELLLGGGRHEFPAPLLSRARAEGYAIVYNLPELNRLDPIKSPRVLGLFAEDNLTYEADRPADSPEPRLQEMAGFALERLSQNPDGFFLMIEAGLIDHACHLGKLDKAIAEVLEFNAAVETVLAWMGNRTDTLLIVTADHETGGLTIAGDHYQKGDTVKAKFTTKTIPGVPALHSKQRVPLFALGPNSAAVKDHLDNTAVYCLVRHALLPPE